MISYISQLVIRYLQIALLWMVNRSKLKNHKKVRKSRTIALPTMKVRGTHSSTLILMSLKEPAELLSVVLDVRQQEVSKAKELIQARKQPSKESFSIYPRLSPTLVSSPLLQSLLPQSLCLLLVQPFLIATKRVL